MTKKQLWIEWIKALKTKVTPSGKKLRKAKGMLNNSNGNCCLGVLCKLSEEFKLGLEEPTWRGMYYVNTDSNVKLAEFIGIDDDSAERIVVKNDGNAGWPIDYLIDNIAPKHLRKTLREL